MMSNKLAAHKLGFRDYFALSMVGMLPYAYIVSVAAGYVTYAGYGALFVGFLAFALVLVMSLPIIEYTRLANFTGGYYGLAERGFGKIVGKYTALLNYGYYTFFSVGNALEVPMIGIATIYLVLGVLPPYWAYVALSVTTVVILYIGSFRKVSTLPKIGFWSVITQMVVLGAVAAFIIIHTPYNSLKFLNPVLSTNGFRGIALAAAAFGFLNFTGYGNPLFYSEEGKESKRDAWRAIIVALIIYTIVGQFAVYAEIVSVHSISTIAGSPLPLISAALPYLGTIPVLILGIMGLPWFYTCIISTGGSQARLLYSMSRDDFIRSSKLKKLDKNQAPRNAATANFIIVLLVSLAITFIEYAVYGWNETSLFYMAFTPWTTAVLLWYGHHFIPDIALYTFYKKNKIKVSLIRKVLLGIAAPATGVGLFIFAFYYGIIGNLVEPYLAFVILGLLLYIGFFAYVIVKRKSLGEDVIKYMDTEIGISNVSGVAPSRSGGPAHEETPP